METDLTTLPVHSHLAEIHQQVAQSAVTILTATPGSGKTLLVAPYLVQNSTLRIAMLQPRRVAARMSAESIAKFNGWEVGQEVGLLMKDVHKKSKATRLTVMTEGVLSRMLAAGEAPDYFDLIILDEFHERSLHTDLACAWIKRQKALKLLVMSATLDLEPLKTFFPDCSLIEIEGRAYPIESHYLKRAFNFHDRGQFDKAFLNVSRRALNSVSNGSVLVFLPGRGHILQARDQLLNQGIHREYDAEIHTLYGQASKDEQKKALAPGPQRKIILSTNIAETSLTIPNVRVVIDSGLQKESHYNAISGVTSLSMHRVAIDGATQRAGRAGRQQAGLCFKMWTPADEQRFRKTKPAEIHRIDPIEYLLKVYSFGGDPGSFECIEKPKAEQLALALKRLEATTCLADNTLTDLGRWVAQFPGAFSLGVLAAVSLDKKFYKEALLAILILQEGDPAPFLSQKESFQSLDPLRSRLGWLKDNSRHPYHTSAASLDRKIRKISASLNKNPVIENFEDALVFAFPHRICRYRDKKRVRGIMSTGRGVKVLNPRPQEKSEYYIALKIMDHKLHGQTESEVQFLFDVHKKTIIRIHEKSIRTKTNIEARGKKSIPKSFSYRCFWDLPLEDPQGQPLEKSIMVDYMKEKFSELGLDALKDHLRSLELVHRIQFCNHHTRDMGWPGFLTEDWELIVEAAYSETDRLELKDDSWLAAIQMLLTESQISFLESFAPLNLATKLRKQNPISYENPIQAKVSIILQDAFEFKTSPMIGNGTVPLAVELLAPSRRPIEVSKDMKQFWISSYPEVRKQYRGRYPRHAWPEQV